MKPLSIRPTGVSRCACGHSLSHREVVPVPDYTGWAWFSFLMGVTAKPRRVLYRCLRCKQVLGSTRDDKVLSKFD